MSLNLVALSNNLSTHTCRRLVLALALVLCCVYDGGKVRQKLPFSSSYMSYTITGLKTVLASVQIIQVKHRWMTKSEIKKAVRMRKRAFLETTATNRERERERERACG